jgi:predicted nucleic acid-binding protein
VTLVVDASVACKWFVEEALSDAARRVPGLAEDLIAPELIVVEVANALWRGVRDGRVLAPQAEDALTSLPRFFAELASAATIAPRALAIARELDHAVYDCVYLALAELRDARVISADTRLAEKVAGTKWSRRVEALAGKRSVVRAG